MSFNPNIKRIGFCCKYVHPDQSLKKKLLEETQRPYNTRSTTAKWLNDNPSLATDRLTEIVFHNLNSLINLITYTGSLDPNLRMVRLGSDVLPMYTHKQFRDFYKSSTIQNILEREFATIGTLARELDVRISFHPGQFTVLASDNPEIVENSIEEFEYHADMARWMGYGQKWMDMKINVHISGRRGYQGIIDVLPRLSTEARNTLTIENDEMSHGLDASLMLEKHVALVLDIHHHFVREGEYILPSDDRVKRVIDSWRGQRPVLHYSYSRNEHLPEGFDHAELPDMAALLEAGNKKQKLRAHSDFYPNRKANDWALSFIDQFDIQCESKMKNLASKQLYEQYIQGK